MPLVLPFQVRLNGDLESLRQLHENQKSIVAYVNALESGSPLPGGGSTSVFVGDFELFQDADGGLKARAPDGTVITLVSRT